MSSLYDMISAFIAMLMSAAFLHFGAAGDSPPAKPLPASHTVASADSSGTDDADAPLPASQLRPAPHHLSAHCHGHAASGGVPAMQTVHAPSPLRHG